MRRLDEKERERIVEKYLGSKKHSRRMRRYRKKVINMTQDERDAELEKCERKIAQLEDEEWLRKRSLRFAGVVILSFFAIIYAALWLAGISIRTIWGGAIVSAITFLFIFVIGSFMDVYRNGYEGEDDEE